MEGRKRNHLTNHPILSEKDSTRVCSKPTSIVPPCKASFLTSSLQMPSPCIWWSRHQKLKMHKTTIFNKAITINLVNCTSTLVEIQVILIIPVRIFLLFLVGGKWSPIHPNVQHYLSSSLLITHWVAHAGDRYHISSYWPSHLNQVSFVNPNITTYRKTLLTPVMKSPSSREWMEWIFSIHFVSSINRTCPQADPSPRSFSASNPLNFGMLSD